MKKILLLLTILSVIVPIKAQEVLIYSDDGTWLDGIVALEHFFEEQGVSTQRIFAADLNSDNWEKETDAIIFPGGYSYNYQLAISLDAIDQIRAYVANGGSYIGICAGAYFATKTVEWEGGSYPYELGLFDGIATGSLDYIAPWPEFTMTNLTLDKTNPINTDSQENLTVLYYGGPIFTPNPGVEVSTLATWNEANNTAAIINFEYNNGRVLLLGPHLEIEEDDDRDGTEFASALTDVESDWSIFWNGFKWVTNSSISTNVNSINSKNFDLVLQDRVLLIESKREILTDVSITLYSLNGHELLSGENSLNVAKIESGIYLVKVEADNKFYYENIQIVN